MIGTILKGETFDHWPWVCTHDIPAYSRACLCGHRIAILNTTDNEHD